MRRSTRETGRSARGPASCVQPTEYFTPHERPRPRVPHPARMTPNAAAKQPAAAAATTTGTRTRDLGHFVRSGIAGGVAGCVVRLFLSLSPLCAHSRVCNDHRRPRQSSPRSTESRSSSRPPTPTSRNTQVRPFSSRPIPSHPIPRPSPHPRVSQGRSHASIRVLERRLPRRRADLRRHGRARAPPGPLRDPPPRLPLRRRQIRRLRPSARGPSVHHLTPPD